MDADSLRSVDWEIIKMLRQGRNNAPNIANETDYSQQYIRERLNRLREENIVTNIGSGIYELNPENVPEQNS